MIIEYLRKYLVVRLLAMQRRFARQSSQLFAYAIAMVREQGFEPRLLGPEPSVLPLDDSRLREERAKRKPPAVVPEAASHRYQCILMGSRPLIPITTPTLVSGDRAGIDNAGTGTQTESAERILLGGGLLYVLQRLRHDCSLDYGSQYNNVFAGKPESI